MSKKTEMSRRGFLSGSFLKRKSDDSPAPETATQKEDTTLAKANAAYREKDYAGAASLYREFSKTDPNNLEARQRLGRSLYQCGKYVQAKIEFQRALRIDPADNYSKLYLGLALARMDKTETALETLKTFFDPKQIELQREINIQIAMAETDDQLTGTEIADNIERCLR